MSRCSTAAIRSDPATAPARRSISGCAQGSRERRARAHRGQRHERVDRRRRARSAERSAGRGWSRRVRAISTCWSSAWSTIRSTSGSPTPRRSSSTTCRRRSTSSSRLLAGRSRLEGAGRRSGRQRSVSRLQRVGGRDRDVAPLRLPLRRQRGPARRLNRFRNETIGGVELDAAASGSSSAPIDAQRQPRHRGRGRRRGRRAARDPASRAARRRRRRFRAVNDYSTGATRTGALRVAAMVADAAGDRSSGRARRSLDADGSDDGVAMAAGSGASASSTTVRGPPGATSSFRTSSRSSARRPASICSRSGRRNSISGSSSASGDRRGCRSRSTIARNATFFAVRARRRGWSTAASCAARRPRRSRTGSTATRAASS